MYKAGLSYSRGKSKPYCVIKIVDTTPMIGTWYLHERYNNTHCLRLSTTHFQQSQVYYIPITEWPKNGV